MPTVIARIGGWLPRGWGDLLRQIGIYLLANFSYEIARGMADGRPELAFGNGTDVIQAEQSLHLFSELSFQSAVIGIEWLMDVANFIYLNSQFTVAMGFLIWMYFFRNEKYYFFRNMLIIAMALALIGYIGMPTAPPRMYPELGFVDTINAQSPVNHDSALARMFINPYAAMPSMHCAVALIVGGTGFMVCRRVVFRVFWALWPIVVAWVTVVTANHFWLDVFAGQMVALVSFLIAWKVLAQISPARWGWNAARDHAKKKQPSVSASQPELP